MDILEKHGIKILNSVLIKSVNNTETDDEVVEFLSRFGKTSKVKVITEADSCFYDMIIVEFESGNALVELRKILPYTYNCDQDKVIYEITELSTACSEIEGKVKTQKYLGELKNLAKLTGQDYAEVLKGVMSLLGQSILEQNPTTEVKTLQEEKVEVLTPVTSTAFPTQQSSAATSSLPQVGIATTHNANDEFQQDSQNPHGHYTTRPSLPTMSFADLNPPGIQRYVVEHIVKSDENAVHMSSQRLRSFSGRAPRPQNESDYETWRSGVDLLLRDPAVSDLQRSRKIFESLLPPAADMVKHLQSDTPPSTYLQILDSAYGTVQDGDELYAKFMELFQDAGEKPSTYLQRLQVALNLAVKRGLKATDLDRHLLNQFCRGCWNNTLISELQLKQRKAHPPSFAELLLLLRTEEDRDAAKAERMKQHLGSKAKAGVHVQYTYASQEERKVDALTSITQQLAQQLADIQKQLASLTSQKKKQPSVSEPSPVSKFSETWKNSKPTSRSSHKVPKPGYCYNCGEDGHMKTQCDNAPNPSLVATKKKQFSEKQKKWQRSNPHSAQSLN